MATAATASTVMIATRPHVHVAQEHAPAEHHRHKVKRVKRVHVKTDVVRRRASSKVATDPVDANAAAPPKKEGLFKRLLRKVL